MRGLFKIKKTDTKISYDLQKRYRSGIRLLLYLVNHSRPELSNTVRELSKRAEESNMSHNKAILHSTKYVIGAKYYCYQMKPDKNINGPWEQRGYGDADYTGDKNNRKSVKG